MRAADTNLVVRAIANDDPQQSPIARRWFEEDAVFLSQTVLLETEWILRSVLGWPRDRVGAVLSALLRNRDIVVERGSDAIWATERHAQGADFADMLHLAASRRTSVFATFDRTLAAHAGAVPPVPIETLR